MPRHEFILTWVPELREKYEFENSDARRVANQPIPQKLKYSLYLSTSSSSVAAASSSPVDHLLLYRYGVFSMHFIEYSASKMKKYEGFQSTKPEEAETLYTNDEWRRFAKDLTEVIRNHPTGQLPSDAVHTVINEENGRRAYLGVEWVFDTYNEERSQPRKWEFILTWIPEKRRAYEREHPGVRRISEEPTPRCLKYQWKPSINASSSPPPTTSLVPIPIAALTTYGGGESPNNESLPAYGQVINSQEVTSLPSQTVQMCVNPSVSSDEGQSPIQTGIGTLPFSSDKYQSVNPMMTHNVIRSSSPSGSVDPSTLVAPAIQFCGYCGSKREPGSGLFCTVCGHRIPTHD